MSVHVEQAMMKRQSVNVAIFDDAHAHVHWKRSTSQGQESHECRGPVHAQVVIHLSRKERECYEKINVILRRTLVVEMVHTDTEQRSDDRIGSQCTRESNQYGCNHAMNR